MASFFSKFKNKSEAVARATPRVISLELSGPILAETLQTLITACDEDGGIERYIGALKFKTSLFQDAFKDGGDGLSAENFVKLCMFMPTVRRRISTYVEDEHYPEFLAAIKGLFGAGDIDARITAFVGKFPQDKKHRWVKDLAAEILHNTDPNMHPLMLRWVWDRKANSGVIREIWHGEVDSITLDVDDDYEVFMKLREELSGFLTTNGIFADVLYYVDLLCAQSYGNYISAQGGLYLKADFSSKEETIVFTRRLLGLDGVSAKSNLSIPPSIIDGEATNKHSIDNVLRLNGSN
ncbi:MAG: hypothetical protein JKX72_02945 [Robiginitomaculum sp.]|nr:hypothetical protein [Robiginitomaculum sp.]